DGDARRDPDAARHGHEERRVLVAVADPGAQHLARRWQTDRRLLVENRVDVPRDPLRLVARGRRVADREVGLRADFRRVALDERLRIEILRGPAVRWTGLERLRILERDDVPLDALA